MGFGRPTNGTQEFQNNRIDLRLRMLISPSICWPLGNEVMDVVGGAAHQMREAKYPLSNDQSCCNILLLTGSIPSAEMGSAQRFGQSRYLGNLISCPEFADERAQHRRKGYGNGITRAASAARSRYSQTRGALPAES